MAGPRPLRSTDPRRIGDYDLLALLGEGGQGTVFLARSADGREVAVKLLRSEALRDPRGRRFLERELASVERVASFCTARILSFHPDEDAPHLVSEYIPGPTLHEHITENGPLSGPSLVTLAIATATALAAIHEAGVVHRDFKPANVLLGPDGPRVIDFGIARPLDAATGTTSHAVGTPAYMAPEQLAGEPVGPPLDMFAWGCAMVYAANARTPFGGTTPASVIFGIMNREPDLGDLTEPLRGLVAGCLAKQAAARPTATQVLVRLLGDRVHGNLLSEGASAAATLLPPAAPPPVVPPVAAPPPPVPPVAVPPVAVHPPAAPAYPVPGTPAGPWAPQPTAPAVAPPAHTTAAGTGRGRPARRPAAVAAVAVLVTAATGAVIYALSDRGGSAAAGASPRASAGRTSPAGTSPAGTGSERGAACSYVPDSGGGDVPATGTPPPDPVSGPSSSTVTTNLGDIVIRLDAAKAPCTVNSFRFLAKSGYFSATSCHRLTTAATRPVLQCGDPSGTGTGGPSYRFANENGATSFDRGMVAMANTGSPDTNGSQFFIVYGEVRGLTSEYSVFGTVTEGLGIVDSVAAGGTADGSEDGRPKKTITIRRINA